jgi:hypothetical protein
VVKGIEPQRKTNDDTDDKYDHLSVFYLLFKTPVLPLNHRASPLDESSWHDRDFSSFAYEMIDPLFIGRGGIPQEKPE